MYKVETYALARHAYYIEGKSQRQIAKELGVNRRSIQKMLKQAAPPGYKRTKPARKPKLDPHKAWIDEILETDKTKHRKQRHTMVRIFNRLKEERGFTGCYVTVCNYVMTKRLKAKAKEMFVPLEHDPGMAQCDFGEADVIINQQKLKAHFLVMQLPFSDSIFVKAYPAENTESFCDGHVESFKFFNGVPIRILYDNTTIAVSKILANHERKQTQSFIALKSHYLFTAAFAGVAKGNEKGGVENLVGYARRNFMVPLPEFPSFEALNEYLAKCCRKEQAKIKRGHDKTVAQRLAMEAFLPLPEMAYECCRIQPGQINSCSLVRFGDNDYSVPTPIGQQKVLVKGFVERVVISYQNQIIAEHSRHYGREEVIFNPLHYLKLLERKTRAFEQAAPLKKWNLPPVFAQVHDILYQKDGTEGRRSYIRILQLLQTYSLNVVKKALEEALSLKVVNETAIKHLVRRQAEGRPVNLSLLGENIPVVYVALPDLSSYRKSLLTPSVVQEAA